MKSGSTSGQPRKAWRPSSAVPDGHPPGPDFSASESPYTGQSRQAGYFDPPTTAPGQNGGGGSGGRSGGGAAGGAALAAGRVDQPSLNPRYTFEAFVIGSSNRFAHAAAQRVAETPAASYNPLFIYGDSGLGKTHLLHAIGHYGIENFPGMRIRYVSTETFMNDFVDAIRNNSQMIFKRRYRDCDVLLVDDIQFMEGKEGLQEEFFHTFNSLYEGSKQIVLSSDRHPRSIATLEDRLRSRFEWGLTTDVQPPELETRLAILRKKADGERIPIPGEVLELIATHVRDNIRELEGALIRVSAFASLNQEPPTQEMAERVLSDILDFGRPRQITPKVIMDAVVHHLRVQRGGPVRHQPAPTAGQRPPDRDVRLPGADRLQLPGDRPRVRRPRPHHGDPRRREGVRPHEGTPSDLRPGDRAHLPHQGRHLTVTPARAGDQAREPTVSERCHLRGQPTYRPQDITTDVAPLCDPGDGAIRLDNPPDRQQRLVVHNSQHL